jgi:hypothetical protein
VVDELLHIAQSQGYAIPDTLLFRAGQVFYYEGRVSEVRLAGLVPGRPDTAGQQQWRQLARQAALRGKQVAVLPVAAYGGHKDVNEAWVAGTLAVDTWCTPAEETGARLAVSADLHEAWEERVAIMRADGHLRPADAARLAWEGLQWCPSSSMAARVGYNGTPA